MWCRMLYSDQQTVARLQGVATLYSLHTTKLDHLEGYICMYVATSDWHTKLCLVTVSYLI